MAIASEAYCATVARTVGAQLYGSAPEAEVWIMLEYTGTWGRDAFPESDMPEAVKAHIGNALKTIPKARLQLIKQDPPYDLPDITLAIAICREVDPALYVFEFNDCEDVTALDIVDVIANEATYAANRVSEPIVLICTNAKRDRCCAIRGLPVYSQLVEIMGTAVWRTTHLGGHRFGATGVVLPSGMVYGRIDDVDASAFAADVIANRLHLPALRGRSLYAPEVQAAEYFLRDEGQVSELEAYRWVGMEEIGVGRWDVRFTDLDERVEHMIGVARAVGEAEIIASCGKESERVIEHQLLYHRIETA